MENRLGPSRAIAMLAISLAGACSSLASPDQYTDDPVAYPAGGTGIVNLEAANVVGDARVDLIGVSRDNGSVVVLEGLAGGQFASPRSYDVGGDLLQAVAGDVNGDGIPDLLAAGHLTNSLYVRLGLGGDAFGPLAAYPLRNHGNRLVVADFDGDGIDDVVVSHDGSGQPIYVTTFLGSPTGELQRKSEIGTEYFTTWAIEAGDFDGDGRKDVAIAMGDNRAAVLVLKGRGTGEFETPVPLPTFSPEQHLSDGTTSIAIGDINGDGRDDIVTSCFAFSNRVGVRISTPTGFVAPLEIALPSPVDVSLADLDGDGKLDLVAVDIEQGSAALLLGHGGGLFSSPRVVPMGAAPSSVAVGDFDGNGVPDMATVGLGESVVRVLLNPYGK
jgi:hypothetical protein